MASTRKAQKEAEMSRISQIGDFKKRIGGVMELPSGLIVKLKNPGGLRAFLGNDTIPNRLMVIIQGALDKGKGVQADELMPDGKIDPEMLRDMMQMMDAVALQCIVEPKFLPKLTQEDVDRWNESHDADSQVEDPEQLRSDEKLYIDELPDDDKQFIFGWVSGGTSNLEQFRKQHDRSLASVADVAVAGSNAK